MSGGEPPGTLFEFRFGDVFPADDVVSEWLVTIALAFNDVALAHGELESAFDGPAYRYFYFLRLGIAHFKEAAKYLDQTEKIPEVVAFVASLPDEIRAHYADCLERYRRAEGGLAQIRDLSVFHYPELVIQPGAKRPRVVQKELHGLANAPTSFFRSETGTIGAARLLFADDLASRLFRRGTPDDADLHALHDEIRAAITSFMRFANGAIEPRLADALDAGKLRARAGRPPTYAEAAEAMDGEPGGGELRPPEVFEPAGSTLYHYTRLDTAMEKILLSGTLRMGLLSEMRDPRESQIWSPTVGGFSPDSDDSPYLLLSY